MDSEKLPTHIAIIMDGNRRWAKENGLDVPKGHKQGAKTLEDIVRYCNKIGIKYLTVYAFSSENWKRAKEEVGALMLLLQNYLDDYSKRADTENIKVNIIGDVTRLSLSMQKSIKNCIERTRNNTGVCFNIALNYGGRDEIVSAVREIAQEVKLNKLDVNDITQEKFAQYLYTKDQPDPDLVIRTSGELRTSNFLPWQIVYSEFVFLDKYWPDFTENDLDSCIEIYQKRKRKFGAG